MTVDDGRMSMNRVSLRCIRDRAVAGLDEHATDREEYFEYLDLLLNQTFELEVGNRFMTTLYVIFS